VLVLSFSWVHMTENQNFLSDVSVVQLMYDVVGGDEVTTSPRSRRAVCCPAT